jgi:hypothetical protein
VITWHDPRGLPLVWSAAVSSAPWTEHTINYLINI